MTQCRPLIKEYAAMQERIDGLNEKHKTMEERDQTYKEYQENKKKLKGLEAKLDDREVDIFKL